jgi:shikimate dehydrogenase
MSITGHTAIYGVVGNPVEHSMSPVIHNLWLKQAGIDAVYMAFPLQQGSGEDELQALHKFGVKGLNITMPFKDAALASAVSVSERAELIAASNTLASRESGWFADNSDADGFIYALKYADGTNDLAGRKVVLLGAGGAARAVAYALAQEGVELSICNRTLSKAEIMAKTLAPSAKCYGFDQATDLMSSADIVVNATSMGFGSDGLTLPQGEGRLFYELSYGEAGKAMTDPAAAAGWKTEDGLRMLVGQAAVSFELWHGIKPDIDAAVALCLKVQAS